MDLKVAVDSVIFGYTHSKLYVLLIKRKFHPYRDYYALPGGFILENESAEDAIIRELKEETNVNIDYIEQFNTYSLPSRDPRGRVISIAFLGFVDPTKYNIMASTDASDVIWMDYNDLNSLEIAFDHYDMIKLAKKRIENKIRYTPIVYNILPERFTFTELYNLYNTILTKEIDKGNLYKQLKKFPFINFHEKTVRKSGVGRKSKEISFNQEKFNKFIIKGLNYFL